MYDRFRIFIRGRKQFLGSALDSDAEMPIIGEVGHYLEFEAIALHNDVGKWRLKLPRSAPEVDLFDGATVNQDAQGSAAGKGIVVYLARNPNEPPDANPYPVFSGKVTGIERNYDSEDDSGEGTVTYTGVSDDIVWANKLAWPWPKAPIQNQRSGGLGYWDVQYTHYTSADAAVAAAIDPPNTALYNSYVCGHPQATQYDFIPYNAVELVQAVIAYAIRTQGYTAAEDAFDPPGRYIPEASILKPADPTNIPPDKSYYLYRTYFRMVDIREFVATIAAAYGISIRTMWEPQHRFTTGALRKNRVTIRPMLVPDKTDSVVFGKDLGNLRAYNYKLNGPTRTRAIIAGSGKGIDQYYALRQDDSFDPPGWDDIRHWTALEREWDISGEILSDRSDIDWDFHNSSTIPSGDTYWAADPPEASIEDTAIDQAAQEIFTDHGPSASITMDVLDTPEQAYGSHYSLGDKVTIIIDGETRQEVIQQVTFRHDSDGLKIIPVAGTALTANTVPYVYRQLRRIWNKLTGVGSIESLTYDKLTIGVSDPKNGEPKVGSFTVDGVSSEATPNNVNALVKLQYRQQPIGGNWGYTADAAQAPDTAGAWAFPSQTIPSGKVFRQYRAEIKRVPTGEIQYTAPVTVVRGTSGTTLELPQVTSFPYGPATPILKQGATVTINGYAAPGATLQVQHAVLGGSFSDVSLIKGTSTGTDDDGHFSIKFRAHNQSNGVGATVNVRVKQTYKNPVDGVSWASGFQTQKTSGSDLQYFSVN